VCDRNCFCTGSTPTQNVDKLVPFTLKRFGKKVYVVAADYNYGQITSKWVKKFTQETGITVTYSEVINAAPEHAEALQALEGLFEGGVKQLVIGQILEPLYQSAGEWEKLIQVHEAELTHITEPDERIQMYYRIAEDAEERGGTDRAALNGQVSGAALDGLADSPGASEGGSGP